MADFTAKGQDLFAQAEKKLKSLGWFGNKYEEAAELLEKAANNFKLVRFSFRFSSRAATETTRPAGRFAWRATARLLKTNPSPPLPHPNAARRPNTNTKHTKHVNRARPGPRPQRPTASSRTAPQRPTPSTTPPRRWSRARNAR